MTQAERNLLIAIAQREPGETVRDVCQRIGVPKQNHYYLGKWCNKGWYEFGVSLDLGWLTAPGKVAADLNRDRKSNAAHD